MNLASRSYQKELLDHDDIPFDDIRQNMQELNFINTWLGGHTISIDGLKRLIGTGKTITICEIGCGGGDNLVALKKWCKKQSIFPTFIGVDIKAECISFAQSRKELQGDVTWIASDYRIASFEQKPDIIFSSLFCHHFTNDELIFQLKWMKQNSKLGFFINDLQRHFLAYHLIKWLTKLFSSSYLVKNDAPLSVAKGFTKSEWIQLLKSAHIQPSGVQWKWAFRYLVSYSHA